MTTPIDVKWLGRRSYQDIFLAMKAWTATRSDEERDQIWLVEHPPVFTLGRKTKPEHILNTHDIPIIQSDRGGQVTYHGPGQLIIYCLLNLKSYHFGIRSLVELLENSVIEFLLNQHIHARSDRSAPGVYVDNAKIAALGLRVSRGYTYHGISLNVDMDLQPFTYINPCGYQGLSITQCADLGVECTIDEVGLQLSQILIKRLLLEKV